ncbi:cache domain-containing sensor histidine kinase [Paenibacillus sp. LPE1-1-1.1]|uniref:cache domain-containing sensor histidine kinase n=1 Tax=Paenibacillus sp. LPE1-1-1.1 TaxID=3135230 RepID=UPI0034259599
MNRLFTRGMSFRTKLIAAFLVASILPLLILQAFTNYQTGKAMQNKIDELVQINLMQTAKSLDSTLSSYRDLVFQLFTDADVFLLVNRIIHDDPDKAMLLYDLQDKLIHYAYTKQGIRSISVLMPTGQVISFDKESEALNGLWPTGEEALQLELYKQAMTRENESVITSPEAVQSIHNNESYVFHIARKITNLQPGNTNGVGVLVITLYESVLNHATSLTPPNIRSYNVLVDGSGAVVSALDKSMIGKTVEQIPMKAPILNSYKEKVNGWSIVNLTEQIDLFEEMYKMQRLGWIAGLLAILLSSVMIYYFSDRLTDSIRKVVKAMQSAQRGRLNVQVEELSKDEISIIATNFNKMMANVNRLMGETTQANRKQKEAEIRALEAQINPHFLYNTLDSINWMAIEKDEHDISRMLKSLAQILRYSINASTATVTVRDELEWLRQYVFLQKHRFDDAFECEIECEPELLDVGMHKLLLQPFIENSIVHAFSGITSGGKLGISLYRENKDFFIIRIEDNGKGMSADNNLLLVNGEYHASSESISGSGLGIRNTFDRLRIYYGGRASWGIQSELGRGTVVTLQLPLELNKED